MPGDERPHDQPGERAALEELERLHQAIEQSRRKRREANDAFDSFLRSFERRPAAARADAGATNVRTLPRTSEPPALSPSALPPSGDAAPEAPDETDAHGAEPVVPAAFSAPVEPSRTGLFWILAAAAVLVLALISWRLFVHGESTSPSPQPAAAPPASQAVPTPAPAPAPPPPIAPATELATARRVWVRVTVDGERVLERELDAGVRIPLEAKERIVIRAGDAGAIRLTIAGKDQGVFGPDGIAVTRTFVVPPASPR